MREFLTSRHSNRASVRLRLDPFEPRDLPSATIDLTTHGSEGIANDAILRQCDAQPTGTGVIRSFVRIQGKGVEQGYNTDGRPLQFDENKSPQFTRSLTLGQVPTVEVNGVSYREFLLDINQSASSPLLSLDEMRVYVGSAPDLTGYDSAANTLGGLTPVFDLDGAGDVTVIMNYRLNSGSGSGDIFVLVPESAFAGLPAENFVYLYSKFGGTCGGNAGFEEWAVPSNGPTQGPPAALASLSGTVYFDANGNGVRDANSPGVFVDEHGLEGIIVVLQGTNDLGDTVVLTTTTDADGHYTFAGLRPGTYSIMETQPQGYLDGGETLGSLGGQVENDRFFAIKLNGIDGVGYDFGEIPPPPDPG